MIYTTSETDRSSTSTNLLPGRWIFATMQSKCVKQPNYKRIYRNIVFSLSVCPQRILGLSYTAVRYNGILLLYTFTNTSELLNWNLIIQNSKQVRTPIDPVTILHSI